MILQNIESQSSRKVAKVMAVLPQSPQAPNGISVDEVVAYGRVPHQGGFGKLQKEEKRVK